MVQVCQAPPDSPSGTGRVVWVAEGFAVPKMSDNAGRGMEPWPKLRIRREQGHDF